MIERRSNDDRMTKEVTKQDNARNLKKENPSKNDITIPDMEEGLLSANHSINNYASHNSRRFQKELCRKNHPTHLQPFLLLQIDLLKE